MSRIEGQTTASIVQPSKTRRWTAKLKVFGVIVGIIVGLTTVANTVYTVLLSRANRADIRALQLVNASLQQQNASLQVQREAQERQNDNWQRQIEEQRLELGRLRQEQAGLQQALSSAQTVGALKARILSDRQAIRELWANVVDKDFYLPHSAPPEELARQGDLLATEWRTANKNSKPLWLSFFLDRPIDTSKDDERKVVLAEKEERFEELLAAAKALGLIEEMPKSIKSQYPKNLTMKPIRAIYRFTDEQTWWTVFQDFGPLPDAQGKGPNPKS